METLSSELFFFDKFPSNSPKKGLTQYKKYTVTYMYIVKYTLIYIVYYVYIYKPVCESFRHALFFQLCICL